MPFIPHTEEDVKHMLDAIGVASIEQLFDEIPAALRNSDLNAVPPGVSEMEVAALLQARAQQDRQACCFVGAGAYDHHIPAAVWELATRGEFYSAYTPYQAEASQGTLQLLYEYQSMITGLTAMDAANASLYDGASALAEALLMAIRANRKSDSKTILLPRGLSPRYRQVAQTIVHHQQVKLQELAYGRASGTVAPGELPADPGDITAVVIAQPNFFGCLEEVDAITDWAHRHGALVIAVVNPLALNLLKPPGQWGERGADIVCGEGQPLGIPLASGGPYFGFMCCRGEYVRQMPGRIIGRTVDSAGKPGFSLTLQAREQHIRRSKATSNICTNQGLLVTAATIHMAVMGADGLARTARACHHNSAQLAARLQSVAGVERVFNAPFFHEVVLRLNRPVAEVLAALRAQGIAGGYALEAEYPELQNCLLVCATEKRTAEEIERYGEVLRAVLSTPK